MSVPFSTSEFYIEDQKPPIEVIDKIWKYHIIPMLDIRERMNVSMFPSQRSAYRSKEWELSKGRSGNSQHTFEGKGACDWTCKDFDKHKERLLNELITNSKYTRIAVYNSFIHCDLKANDGNVYIYISDANSKWELTNTVRRT